MLSGWKGIVVGTGALLGGIGIAVWIPDWTQTGVTVATFGAGVLTVRLGVNLAEARIKKAIEWLIEEVRDRYVNAPKDKQ